MYRTFAKPSSPSPLYNSDICEPVTDGITDKQFKANADIMDGCNGQCQINTNYDNTETDSNAIGTRAPFDLSEDDHGDTTEANKRWLRI